MPRPVLAADVIGRISRESLRIVSPSDFKIGEWREVERFSADSFVPYCIDAAQKRSLYVKAGRLDAVRRAKFLYLHLRERGTTLLSLPWENGRLLPRESSPPFFVFSVGRCGSTLLVEAMRRSGALGLSEPDFFTQAVAARVLGGPLYAGYDELARAVGNLTDDLLAAFGGEAAGPSLIKLRSECCKAPDLIVRRSDERRTSVFMIREFKPWAASMLRVTKRSPRSIVASYLDGLACLHWLQRNTNCLVLTYEELTGAPDEAFGRIALALGAAPDVRRLKTALKSDSQAGTPLAAKKTMAGKVHQEALARALEVWMAQRPSALLSEVGLSGYC